MKKILDSQTIMPEYISIVEDIIKIIKSFEYKYLNM